MVENVHSTIAPLNHHLRRRSFRLALMLLATAPFAVGTVSADAAGLTAGTLSRAAGDKSASSGNAKAKLGKFGEGPAGLGFNGPKGKTNSGSKGNNYGGSDPSKSGKARTGPGGGAVGGI